MCVCVCVCVRPVQEDPFWTVHSLSQRELRQAANQSICSLEQLLRLATPHNTTVVFTLRRPPPKHPCHHSWINDTLEAVRRTGVPQNLVRTGHAGTVPLDENLCPPSVECCSLDED